MTLATIHRHPNATTLRQFGLATAVLLPAVAWWFDAPPWCFGATLVVGLAAAAFGVWRPQALRGAFVGSSYLTAPVGFVVGELLTASAYFGVFWPIGRMLRYFGRDPLERAFERDRPTYWTPKPAARDATRYLRQY